MSSEVVVPNKHFSPLVPDAMFLRYSDANLNSIIRVCDICAFGEVVNSERTQNCTAHSCEGGLYLSGLRLITARLKS